MTMLRIVLTTTNSTVNAAYADAVLGCFDSESAEAGEPYLKLRTK